MSDGTAIQWTDATWNPIRAGYRTVETTTQTPMVLQGWHCERVSPGCQHCYAETINERRFGTGLPYNRKSRDLVEVYLDEQALTRPLHWRRPRKIFVCSMTDLFGEWVPDEMIDRVFAVMALSPQHTFQVLTKRPERMREYVSATALPPPEKGMGPIHRASKVLWAAQRMADDRQLPPRMPYPWSGDFAGGEPLNWPLPNVWLGTSAEDQERADQRYQPMRDLAQAGWFTWVSAEPLLSDVNVMPWLRFAVGWLVVGGESGPGARSCDVEWIRSIVRQCQAAGVAVFVKQLGARPVDANDGSPVMSLPVSIGDYPGKRLYHLRDRKGGNPCEWPEDLRVREFPR